MCVADLDCYKVESEQDGGVNYWETMHGKREVNFNSSGMFNTNTNTKLNLNTKGSATLMEGFNDLFCVYRIIWTWLISCRSLVIRDL